MTQRILLAAVCAKQELEIVALNGVIQHHQLAASDLIEELAIAHKKIFELKLVIEHARIDLVEANKTIDQHINVPF